MKQYDRKTSTSKTIEFRNISSDQGQRKASTELNIPRGTLRYWALFIIPPYKVYATASAFLLCTPFFAGRGNNSILFIRC